MRNVRPILLAGLVGLTAACTRSDESLVSVETPGAANLFLEDITSERRTWIVGTECTTAPLPPSSARLAPGSAFTLQVIKITARVEWLGTGKCCGTGANCTGFTPRECQAGNLNAGDPCAANSDCDLSAPDDMLGACDFHPCQFDSDCAVGDTCGTVAARLVFASADTDTRPEVTVETGVVLFDNGNEDVIFHTSAGNITNTKVKTGDAVARDLTYTREFAVLTSSTSGSIEECVARTTGITPVLTFPKNTALLFRIDAIDAITGAARLTSVSASAAVPTEIACCKWKLSSSNCAEICNNTEPICADTVCM